jgi:hypothetical protein
MTTDTPDPFAFPACLTRFTGDQDHEPAPSYVALMACYGVDVLAGSPPKELEGGCTLHRPVFTKSSK